MDDNIQIAKNLSSVAPIKDDPKTEDKAAEISPERIERMKKAFRPTWLQEQINSVSKGSNGKKD